MTTHDDKVIDEAAALFREIALNHNVQLVVRGEIPCAQAGIYADMARDRFKAALWQRIHGQSGEGK